MMPPVKNESQILTPKSESSRGFNGYLGIVLFFIISLILVVIGMVTSESSDKNYSFFLWCLFFIPIFIHGIGWYSLHQIRQKPDHKISKETVPELNEEHKEQEGIDTFCAFYNVTMLFSIALYCIAWIGYNKSSSLELGLWRWSVFCIVSIIIQFGILSYVTYTIMEFSHKKRNFTLFLKYGLELCPFWRFAHFFAIFMGISFLFRANASLFFFRIKYLVFYSTNYASKNKRI